MARCVICKDPISPKTLKTKYYCSPRCSSACFLAVSNSLSEKYWASIRIKSSLKDYLNHIECGEAYPHSLHKLEWIAKTWKRLCKKYGREKTIDFLRCRCGGFTNANEGRTTHWNCD